VFGYLYRFFSRFIAAGFELMRASIQLPMIEFKRVFACSNSSVYSTFSGNKRDAPFPLTRATHNGRLSISGGDRSNSQSRIVRRARGAARGESRSRLRPIKSRRLSVRDPAWFTFSERKPARFYSRTKRADLLLFPRRRRRRRRHTRRCKPKLHY